MKKLLLIFFYLFAFANDYNIDAILDEGEKEVKVQEVKSTSFIKDSNKAYKNLKSEFYKKYEYVPPSQRSGLKKDGYCFSSTIKDEEGKNFCLAFARNNKSYCFSSLRDSWKNVCLGYCFNSSLSKAQKALCLAIKNSNRSYCFDSNLEKVPYLKYMCLGRFNKTSCFSIQNERDKNICLGISLN